MAKYLGHKLSWDKVEDQARKGTKLARCIIWDNKYLRNKTIARIYKTD